MANNMLTKEQKIMIESFQGVFADMRKELGISQTEFGKKVGKSRQLISLLERGETEMTWDTFVSFMYFFKVNWDGIVKENWTILDNFLDIRKGE